MSLLQLRGIRKSFDGVEVLRGIDWHVNPGETHALVGENGTGKSILIKIISGVYSPDAGTLSRKNIEQRHFHTRQAH